MLLKGSIKSSVRSKVKGLTLFHPSSFIFHPSTFYSSSASPPVSMNPKQVVVSNQEWIGHFVRAGR